MAQADLHFPSYFLAGTVYYQVYYLFLRLQHLFMVCSDIFCILLSYIPNENLFHITRGFVPFSTSIPCLPQVFNGHEPFKLTPSYPQVQISYSSLVLTVFNVCFSKFLSKLGRDLFLLVLHFLPLLLHKLSAIRYVFLCVSSHYINNFGVTLLTQQAGFAETISPSPNSGSTSLLPTLRSFSPLAIIMLLRPLQFNFCHFPFCSGLPAVSCRSTTTTHWPAPQPGTLFF